MTAMVIFGGGHMSAGGNVLHSGLYSNRLRSLLAGV